MIYEARNSRPVHLALAVATALLSILGLAVAGVIPTSSGEYPAVGWAIVIVCVLVAIYFVKVALSDTVQARIDQQGIFARRGPNETVRWDEIESMNVLRVGIQRIANFRTRSGGRFGINCTFYDKGIGPLVDTVRHYRPELIP